MILSNVTFSTEHLIKLVSYHLSCDTHVKDTAQFFFYQVYTILLKTDNSLKNSLTKTTKKSKEKLYYTNFHTN